MTPSDAALALIEPARMRGIEVGALHRPRVKKSDGDVRYADFYSTSELRQRYEANSATRPYLNEIVDVDYVVKEGSTLGEVAGADGPFDYLIASHVIEHFADPLGWLRGLEVVLAPDGVVSLVVPDRRFSFDVNRLETRPQDWIDWHLRRLQSPSFGQLFDFFAHVTTIDGSVDTAGLWSGEADYEGVRRQDVADPDVAAYGICLQYQELGHYIDVHAGVYTPESFVSLLDCAMRLGLLGFEIASFTSTPVNSLEFYVTLRRVPDGALGRQLGSIALTRRILEEAPSPGPRERRAAEPPGGLTGTQTGLFEVSSRERSLVLLKRRVLYAARTLLTKLHGP